MTDDLINQLQWLANKYEVSSFIEEDPSQFLYWYSDQKDCEIAAFIAAMLSFGNRKQFIPKIKNILSLADKKNGGISSWILNDSTGFPRGKDKYYRFYSYDDLHYLFAELKEILEKYTTFGAFLYEKWISSGVLGDNGPLGDGVTKDNLLAEGRGRLSPLDVIISESFPNSSIVPKGKNSANKRIHMYLRWMVRQNSCVDKGFWGWYPQEKLLIPLDVHVMQEGIKLGLLDEKAKASRKTAELLTNKFNEVFPQDPCRGDYALFGLGVDLEK